MCVQILLKILCIYVLLIFTSLTTSLPVESGLVQYTPLTLFPLIESGSPGI